MAKKQFFARIYGQVQGVGFRFFALDIANEFGLDGYVRNTPDDAVEVCAEGEESDLEEFLQLLKQGPRSAQVTNMDVSWGSARGAYHGFHVRL